MSGYAAAHRIAAAATQGRSYDAKNLRGCRDRRNGDCQFQGCGACVWEV